MAAVDVENPFNYQITAQALAELTPARRPLIPGNTWSLRVRVANAAGVALSLALGSAVSLLEMWMKLSLESNSPVLSRKSSAARVGISPTVYQVVPDANQVTEVLDGDGKPVSGKGWMEIFFDPGDRAALLALVGCPFFCVVVTWLSGQEETVLIGAIEVMRQAKD